MPEHILQKAIQEQAHESEAVKEKEEKISKLEEKNQSLEEKLLQLEQKKNSWTERAAVNEKVQEQSRIEQVGKESENEEPENVTSHFSLS